jgi:hypothetical protein
VTGDGLSTIAVGGDVTRECPTDCDP